MKIEDCRAELDSMTDDEYRDYEERISAGRTGNILETAQIAFEFWRSQKQSWRLSGVAIIDSRRVVLQGSKLTLKLKGSYGNGKPCDDAFPLTIVRLGEDEFLCLKEIQGDRY